MIAIIGSNGQLGNDFVSESENRGIEIWPLDIPEIDITDPQSINKTLTASNITMIINSAAYTAVDNAESEPDLAFAVNRDGPDNLARFCKQRKIPLIHISTDYVFDGNKIGEYLENDPVSPLGVYGASKLGGEKAIIENLDEHVIIRTAWLFGIHGTNFVKTMLNLGSNQKTIRVVSDQKGCPTYTIDLARSILSIADQIYSGNPHWGVYHFCGKGATTWYDFAKNIFQIAKAYLSLKVDKVLPTSSSEYPTPARRPKNSVLNCSKICEHYGIQQRPWIDSLHNMLRNLFHVS